MPSVERTINNPPKQRLLLLQLLLLAVAPILLYGNFLSSPLVFDDRPLFEDVLPNLQKNSFSLDLRWLPLTSFRWILPFAGEEMVWQRIGNLVIHITNASLLLLLLRKLFSALLAGEQASGADNSTLSLSWLAFFGALIFALHPIAVFAVGYLIQRTILMATLFALLTWLLFISGLLHNNQKLLMASAVTYLLAVLSKEHAIMVPAVCAA